MTTFPGAQCRLDMTSVIGKIDPQVGEIAAIGLSYKPLGIKSRRGVYHALASIVMNL